MGGPRNTFQWYKDSMSLSGENSSILTIVNVSLNDGAEYTCEVYNIGPPANASTFVFIGPRIIQQPLDATVTAGNNASLDCLAESFPDPTYQWTFSNGSTLNLNSVSGTETDTLSFQPAEYGNEGGYVCIASTNNITATSDVAILFSKLIFKIQYVYEHVILFVNSITSCYNYTR